MMVYEFRFFTGSSGDAAFERHRLEDDHAAIAKGASELLRMPARHAIEVWAGSRLVYQRSRRPRDR